MARTEPEAGPRLLLEDYGKDSRRWLQVYAAAKDSYKNTAVAPDADDSGAHFLVEDPSSRAARWLNRFDREKAETAGRARAASIPPGSDAPELHLLLEDYSPGPRFFPKISVKIARNGTVRTVVADPSTQPAGNVALEPQKSAPPSRHAEQDPKQPRRGSKPVAAATAPAPKPAEHGSAAAGDPDVELVLEWQDTAALARCRQAQGLSLAAHAVLIAILLLQPHFGPTQPPDGEAMRRESVTLVAPSASVLAELTQPTPNKGKVTKAFEGLEESPRPGMVLAPTPPKPVREAIQVPEPPKIEPERRQEPVPPPAPKLEEKPGGSELAAATSPAPGVLNRGDNPRRLRPDELPAPQPRAPSAQKPKLELENPTTGPGQDGTLQLGSVKLNARPDEVVQAAADNLVKGGGKVVVGDGFGSTGTGGYLPPSPGNRNSTLELLSDPKGVDFRPYLIQVLASVRRNWFAVIPESARLGMTRGRVAIQFIISRNGSVPKLVIADSSSVKALDHAAVAGISASVPFQPLPIEFTGDEVRLQFVFSYNIKTQ